MDKVRTYGKKLVLALPGGMLLVAMHFCKDNTVFIPNSVFRKCDW